MIYSPGDRGGEFRKPIPEIASTGRFFGVKRARSTFFCQLFRGGARRSKVENKDLQSAQNLPYGLVVVSRASIFKMRSEGINEATHPIIGRAGAIDAVHEGGRVPQLPGPRQNVLVCAVDVVGRS